MQYGNAYSSLDDIVGTYGDITSSPGMIGRLRAQQDYKAYMDNLDKRTDLSEDYKNYYRAVNKYNYQDIHWYIRHIKFIIINHAINKKKNPTGRKML